MLTAEALLATLRPPLPYVFPGLMREAEALCEAAGHSGDGASEIYTQASLTWNKLLGPKRRQAS